MSGIFAALTTLSRLVYACRCYQHPGGGVLGGGVHCCSPVNGSNDVADEMNAS